MRKTQTDIIVESVLEKGIVFLDDVVKIIKKYQPKAVLDHGLAHARVVKINETPRYLDALGSTLLLFKVPTGKGVRTVITSVSAVCTADVPPFTRERTTKKYKIRKKVKV
jgi:hypothetical protein